MTGIRFEEGVHDSLLSGVVDLFPVGSEAAIVASGDSVEVRYQGWLYANGSFGTVGQQQQLAIYDAYSPV